MRAAFTESYRASITIKAPLDYVYGWCTDFREDDLKMLGSKLRREIHEKTDRRVIWTVEGKRLRSGTDPVRVVWLRPPDAWRLETCGDEVEIGEYKLTPSGKQSTRLEMVFIRTAGSKRDLPDRRAYHREILDHWARYARSLVRDYGSLKS